jgi:hypothetical protein
MMWINTAIGVLSVGLLALVCLWSPRGVVLVTTRQPPTPACPASPTPVVPHAHIHDDQHQRVAIG